MKRKSFKMLQLLYHSLMTKLSTLPFFLNSLTTYRNLLIYCFVQQCKYQSRVQNIEVEELFEHLGRPSTECNW